MASGVGGGLTTFDISFPKPRAIWGHRAGFSVSLKHHLLLSFSGRCRNCVVYGNESITRHKKPSPTRSSYSESGGAVDNELLEDSKFVPLNADDPVFGPPALLLLGFEVEEEPKIRQFLKDLQGEFLKVLMHQPTSWSRLGLTIIFCSEDMIPRSLWEAMHTNQPNVDVKIAKSLPRICFLSGLSGEEKIMIIDAFPETGLEPAVFATMVPNSADKPLSELIEEIMGDHEMLTSKEQGC